jgi:hypothetical protein
MSLDRTPAPSPARGTTQTVPCTPVLSDYQDSDGFAASPASSLISPFELRRVPVYLGTPSPSSFSMGSSSSSFGVVPYNSPRPPTNILARSRAARVEGEEEGFVHSPPPRMVPQKKARQTRMSQKDSQASVIEQVNAI